MSFLKKLGQIVLQVTTGINTYGPLIKQFTPDRVDQGIDRAGDLSKQLTDVIISVEAVGQVLGTPGPDKMRAAAPLIAQVLLKSDFMVGKKIQDAALFQKGCESIASGLADILNSLKENEGVEVKDFA